ncbi:CynX/NimT family MFS transporter [Caenimonas terrae]|uniref:CynX/NimT family MFS transporter n=1 Tax=Caenimonas terrae TaxID=696074 RepID=A0ABW0NL31_9BURK
MSRPQPQWLVISAGVCAALHVGKLPAALPVLRDSLDVSLLQAGFLLSLVQLAGMALGVVVGLLADGVGLRRTMLAGLLLLAGASALGAGADQPSQLLVLRAVEGLGFLLATMPGPGLIRRLVPSGRLSAALGRWSAFMPLGTALALLCGPLAIGLAGWQGLWLTLAAITLGVALALWAWVPADRLQERHASMPAGWSTRLRQTLTSRGPWVVAWCFAVYSAQWISVIGFLPSIYAQAGLAAGWTAVATAGAAAVNIVGNVAAGRLLQRGALPDRLLLAAYAAMGLGAWVAFGPLVQGLPAPAAVAVRYAAVLVFSMLGGMIPGTLFSAAVRLAPGEHAVSTTVGWMQQWSCAGQVAGPPLVAWVAHRAGGWQWTWLVTGCCTLAGMALAVAARHRLRSSVVSHGAAGAP